MNTKTKTSGAINYILAFISGAVISVMVVCNTELGLRTSNNVSIAVNQFVGILTLTAIMVAGRGNKTINPTRQSAPLWRWFGGLFGLFILTINYFSVKEIGATISMASAVLGQCIMGVVFDLTGFMGMEKRKLSTRKILSLVVSFAGILFMLVFSGKNDLGEVVLFAFLSIISGALTMTQMVYNSGFAKLKGPFFSARQNVISGLAGIVLFMLLFNARESAAALKGLADLNLFQIVSGGMLGCVVVVSANIVIPKIPGAASSILMSAGQIMTAVLLDFFLYSMLDTPMIIGSVLMIAGIMIAD